MTQFYCISSRRALSATTPKIIPCTIAVPNLQASAYKIAFPNSEILSVQGELLCHAVNTILDHNKQPWLAILDDDLVRFRSGDVTIDPVATIEKLAAAAETRNCSIAGMRRVGGRTLPEFSFNEPMTQCLVIRGDIPFRVAEGLNGRWWMSLISQVIDSGGRTLNWNHINRSFQNPPGSESIGRNRMVADAERDFLKRTHPITTPWFARGW